MAIISMFYGIIVSMYYLDKKRHNIPHIHIKYQEQEIVISIPNGDILEGKLKPNKLKLGLRYIRMN
ncbi:MAG: DUF4160 domain-containing protein [Ignavibacteriota bacterium]